MMDEVESQEVAAVPERAKLAGLSQGEREDRLMDGAANQYWVKQVDLWREEAVGQGLAVHRRRAEVVDQGMKAMLEWAELAS